MDFQNPNKVIHFDRVKNFDSKMSELVKCSLGQHLLSIDGGYNCDSCEELFCLSCINEKSSKITCPLCKEGSLSNKIPAKILKFLKELKVSCESCCEFFVYTNLKQHEDHCQIKNQNDEKTAESSLLYLCKACSFVSEKKEEYKKHHCESIQFMTKLVQQNMQKFRDELKKEILNDIKKNGISLGNRWKISEEGTNTYEALVFRDVTTTKNGKDSRYAFFKEKYRDL